MSCSLPSIFVPSSVAVPPVEKPIKATRRASTKLCFDKKFKAP
jgi:hypothetical protein